MNADIYSMRLILNKTSIIVYIYSDTWDENFIFIHFKAAFV